jgi:large subunit ribosomal protein L25
MKSVALTAFPRTTGRRAGAKKLRSEGRVPAVIYGRLNPPQSLEFKVKEIKDVMLKAASEIVLLDLSVQGDTKPKRLALIKEIQHHVLTHEMLHVDLHEVAENEKVTMMVPVDAIGEPAGVRTGGGTLEHIMFKLKVRALPKDLPESLIVDVSHLEIGKAVHLGEIKAPAGVEILGDKHISVLSVAAPVSEAQEAATLEAATTPTGEVEMLKEKKEDGTEAKPGEKAGEKAGAKAGEKAGAKGAEKAGAKGDKAAPAAAEKAAGKKPDKKGDKKPDKKK